MHALKYVSKNSKYNKRKLFKKHIQRHGKVIPDLHRVINTSHTKLQMYCDNCKSLSSKEFKPVVNLKKSGLIIYIHDSNHLSSKSAQHEDFKSVYIILCNCGNKTLNRFDYIAELCQYRTKCYKCQQLIQRIRDLIDNTSTINKNEILSVCEYCKRSKFESKCKRCEYIVSKFLKNEFEQRLVREELQQVKLSEVRQNMLSIMKDHVICKHNVCLDSESKLQLDKLLKPLSLPVNSRQPNISIFPDINIYKKKMNSIQILQEPDRKINLSESSSESTMECICKYLLKREKNMSTKIIPDKEIIDQKDITDIIEGFDNKVGFAQGDINGSVNIFSSKLDFSQKNTMGTVTKNAKSVDNKVSKLMPQIFPRPQTGKLSKIDYITKEITLNDQKISKNRKITTKEKTDVALKSKKQERFDIILEMMKNRKTKHEENKLYATKLSKVKEFAKIPELPNIKRPLKKSTKTESDSENVVECESKLIQQEMIKGSNIVPFDHHLKQNTETKLPVLFKIRHDCNIPAEDNITKSFSIHSELKRKKIRKSSKNISIDDDSGIVLYRLSNPEFIAKGWTQLPSTKVMRRINIYKMIPHSKFDWFERHRKKTLLYDSQEKFAEVYENACGKWFYKDGNVALDYYNAAEINAGKRCIIYSSAEDLAVEKKKPVTILACFDHLGHGVVYDHFGNIRLKYNQSEGIVRDSKIGPLNRWKWHTLNDPPDLHPVISNTYVKDNSCFKDFFNYDIGHEKNQFEEMTIIELDNLMKEKAAKLKQKFKPFHIQPKVVKINDHFSLRIIDQANVCIMFTCGRLSQKLNIGMTLKSDEIIGTEVAEVSDVATSYDNIVPTSNSLKDIQNILRSSQKYNNLMLNTYK